MSVLEIRDLHVAVETGAGTTPTLTGVPLTLTRLAASAHTFAVIEAGIRAPGYEQPRPSLVQPDL